MFSSPPIVLAVFTGLLLALLAGLQVVGSDFLRQVFNDTVRRSEGRRQRRAFEWCLRGLIGSVNYLFALQHLRDLPLQYVPEASTWLTVGQCGLGVVGVAFAVAAGMRLKLQLGY
ncbi:MAG TPA: hypothetical protein VG734_09975 [Lacunisphaera sp.]|nr:hypothetical protein [Lacunisphaera sp.]